LCTSYSDVILLVIICPRPVQIVDEVQHAGVIANDVEVAVVDEDLVVLQQELNVLLGGAHEVVEHGEVDVARVGILQVAYVDRLPEQVPEINKSLKINLAELRVRTVHC
jgi:hypothetical protein